MEQLDLARTRDIGLADLLGVLRKNILALVCLPLAFALAALYYTLSQTPLYRATAWLQVDPGPIKAVSEFDEVYNPGYGSAQYYVTQSLLLTSRKLTERLVERLDMINRDEFAAIEPGPLRRLHSSLAMLPFIPPPPPREALSDAEHHEIVLDRVSKAISVELATASTMFMVHFKSEDPVFAANAANALADLYIEELLQARLDIYQKATSWLTEKLGNVAGDLKSAEAELQAFREDANLINVGGSRGLSEDELIDLSKRLRESQRETTRLQSLYTELQQAGQQPAALASISSLLNDPVITEATDNYLAALNQVRAMEERYGRRHPQMASAQASLQTAERSYLTQLNIKKQSIESELNIARRSEQQLARQVAQVRGKLQQLDRKQFELSRLEREVTSNQQLYDLFLSKFKETQTDSSNSAINARIADPAYAPRKSFEPNIRKVVILAFALGGVVALAIVLLREVLNTRLETPEDLEDVAPNVPLIGSIPVIRKKAALAAAGHFIANDPKSPFAESIRSIKTAIVLTSHGEKLKCIAITSTNPAEGKTTISAGLASSLAASERVLIVDTDMRRSKLSAQFKQRKGRQGLSAVLAGQADVDEVLVHDEVTGVDFIPAGAAPANPALLLDSKAFADLMRAMRERYRYIIIDTPPLGASSDALHLVPSCDAFILVARAEQTQKQGFKNSIKQLSVVNASVFGKILNGANFGRSAKYYGYYGYRY